MVKQFLFIKSATDSISIPSSALLQIEYTSTTSVSLFFKTTKAGKGATTVVVLSVTSGKSNDVIARLNGLVAGSNNVLSFNDVTDVFPDSNITGISSITTTEDPVTAQVGPQGPAGADGIDAEDDKVFLDIRTDEAVSKGDPLYITGYSDGQSRITVAKADASDPAKMPSIGLAADDYSNNTNGRALTMGSFVDVDTSSFSVGSVLYVNSGGGLTSAKPTGTNLIQNVGKVGRSQQNSGEIVVMAIGRSNDVPNLPAGRFFIGSSTNTATSAYTLPTSDGTSNQVLATNGSGAVTFTSFSASDVVNDTTPQLGGNLDVQTFNLFTSSTNGDIQFTPNGTGSINLDGTLKFKRFTSAPAAFEGGMYADNNDDLYFGVS